jgi:hypothetical protein
MIGQLISGVAGVGQSRVVQAGSAALLVPAAGTALHATGMTQDLDAAFLSGGLLDARLWLALAFAVAFGGLGGIVAELLSLHGHIELPHRAKPRARAGQPRVLVPTHEIDLGIFSRILLGAAAALALLTLDAPGSATALVVNSLIAGSAATGVLKLVQGRMLARAQQPTPKKAAAPARDKLRVVPPTATPSQPQPPVQLVQPN